MPPKAHACDPAAGRRHTRLPTNRPPPPPAPGLSPEHRTAYVCLRRRRARPGGRGGRAVPGRRRPSEDALGFSPSPTLPPPLVLLPSPRRLLYSTLAPVRLPRVSPTPRAPCTLLTGAGLPLRPATRLCDAFRPRPARTRACPPPLPPSLGRLSRPAVREIVHIQTGQVSGVPPSPRAAQAACWPPGGRRPRGPSGRTRSLTPAAPCFDLARLDSVETRSVPRYAPPACPPAPPPGRRNADRTPPSSTSSGRSALRHLRVGSQGGEGERASTDLGPPRRLRLPRRCAMRALYADPLPLLGRLRGARHWR